MVSLLKYNAPLFLGLPWGRVTLGDVLQNILVALYDFQSNPLKQQLQLLRAFTALETVGAYI